MPPAQFGKRFATRCVRVERSWLAAPSIAIRTSGNSWQDLFAQKSNDRRYHEFNLQSTFPPWGDLYHLADLFDPNYLTVGFAALKPKPSPLTPRPPQNTLLHMISRHGQARCAPRSAISRLARTASASPQGVQVPLACPKTSSMGKDLKACRLKLAALQLCCFCLASVGRLMPRLCLRHSFWFFESAHRQIDFSQPLLGQVQLNGIHCKLTGRSN